MSTPARRLWLVVVFVTLSASARAQNVNGLAEWTVSRGSTGSEDQPYQNTSFWQSYTLGYEAPLWDPRFLRYTAELLFRTNSLTFGDDKATQQGHQRDVGYKVGAVLFPARPFPFFVQASRDFIGESGDYPSSNAIRGGVYVPVGSVAPEFNTRHKMLNLGWQLSQPSLPRIELGYRTDNSVVSGGSFQAAQDVTDVNLGVFKETSRTQHALRFQRTAFDNLVSQAFNQRQTNLDYEFGYRVGSSRIFARSGRRSTFSLFDMPTTVVDPGTGSYQPPSRGQIDTQYVTTGVSYQPSNRVSIDVTGSMDRQVASQVTTLANLASTSARVEIVRGLSLSAAGTYGDRGETFAGAPVVVRIRTGQVGAAYQTGVRWLQGNVGYSRGIGMSTTPDGRRGDSRSSSEQVSLSSSLRWLSLNTGYERWRNEDEILDYGNFDATRLHASVQAQGGKKVLASSWDNTVVQRGRGATFSNNHQQTFTGSVSYQFRTDIQISANAGGFTNRAENGNDRTLFWGGSWESQLGAGLHLTAWIRREHLTASLRSLDQNGFNWLTELEYRLRLFSFAVEYRRDDQSLRYADMATPYGFQGQQLRVRITRKFGFRL